MEFKFLYGASVQGIQNFIFETSKLSEITGASELVEKICTTFFRDCIGENLFKKENLIIGAAGNIKYVFESEAECQRLVSSFPKIIMNKAPGITISQAVVKFEKANPDKSEINTLENRLKIQRNRSVSRHGLGLMISERSRKTGKAGIDWKKKESEIIDFSQQQKEDHKRDAKYNLLDKILGNDNNLKESNYPNDIKDMLKDTPGYNWVAVVHADGNNLGKVLLNMSEKLEPKDIKKAFSEFSILLEKATTNAASMAYYEVVHDKFKYKLPIRPVIIGGDDLTVIIRGDLALPFTTSFLNYFEEETRKEFKDFCQKYPKIKDLENGLTACAGIAYIKSNYPFYYGVNLCEELCKYSKKIAKNLANENVPSCLTFHKVHSSFFNNYEDVIEEELSAKSVQFNYGPYFLHKQQNYATVKELNGWVKTIKLKDAPKAPLRNWVGELQVNKERAHQQLERIKQINSKKFIEELSLENPFTKRMIDNKGERKEKDFTPIFDVLTIATIQTK
ncbi:MAG: hypothetical protein P8Q41_12105 [Saprospiraceae bacterium]|nr:hypothetical protein [Saprospiraceae bacterium]